MRRKFIGTISRTVGAVPVGRALDSTKPAQGTISLSEEDPLILRGNGTNFEHEAMVGGLVVLPSVDGTAANAEIADIINKAELRLKKPFTGETASRQLSGGIKYKLAPKVDQSLVYDAVFDRLSTGGCVGIFPEGGSHDRTELLPLKGLFVPIPWSFANR